MSGVSSSGRIEVIVSSVSEHGVLPQFRGTFSHSVEAVRLAAAEEYERSWRKMAAEAGVMIRIDKEMVR